MAINKVIFGLDTLIDLTNDAVTSEDVRYGVSFHDKSGARKYGTYMRTYQEGYADTITRADVLNIKMDVTKDVPCFKLGGKQIYMRTDTNKRYLIFAGLKEDGVTESTVQFADTASNNYADTFAINGLYFYDEHTVWIYYTYSNATSTRDYIYMGYIRGLHRKLDGTLVAVGTAYNGQAQAYISQIYKKQYYYGNKISSRWTDLKGIDGFNVLYPNFGNNGSGSWYPDGVSLRCLSLRLSQTPTGTVDVISQNYIQKNISAAGSYFDANISYPGNNVKSRGGTVFLYNVNNYYVALIEDNTMTNFFINNTLASVVPDTITRTLLTPYLPARPTGNVDTPPAPTTGFPYRHIAFLGRLKDHNILVVIRAEITGLDANNKYLYEVFLDFWKINIGARVFTYVNTVDLTRRYTLSDPQPFIMGFKQDHYNQWGMPDGDIYTFNNEEESTYYVKYKNRNEYLALPPGSTTYTSLDANDYDLSDDGYYEYVPANQNVLDTFPKSWDEIVDFAYLDMDGIFYFVPKGEGENHIAQRYQLTFEFAETNLNSDRVRMDRLDNASYVVTDGSSGNLSSYSFSGNKSDMAMGIILSGSPIEQRSSY